ncbi:unnamed protein product [Agarophyton chilense]
MGASPAHSSRRVAEKVPWAFPSSPFFPWKPSALRPTWFTSVSPFGSSPLLRLFLVVPFHWLRVMPKSPYKPARYAVLPSDYVASTGSRIYFPADHHETSGTMTSNNSAGSYSGYQVAYERPGDRYDHTIGRNPRAVRHAVLPSSVEEYQRFCHMYLDSRRFAKIPDFQRGSKNARSVSWYNRWWHFSVDSRWATRCRTLFQADMPYVRCEEEADYQFRVNKLLSDLYIDFIPPHVRFPPAGHNLLALMCFRPPYDHLFWMSNRVY